MTAETESTLESIQFEIKKIQKQMQEQATGPQLPVEGFLRLKHIVGDRKANPPLLPIIPISSSSWWDGVAKGRYPKPVRHQGVTLWKIRDIKKLIKEIEMDVTSPKEA